MITINELIKTFLADYTSDTPKLDAQLILANVMQKSRSWIAAHGDTALPPPELGFVQQAFSRLKTGEPLPYILGHWEFFGLDFLVTKDVLIPRPETELLVEKAIAYLKKHPEQRTVADIGTGSGIIAISIAKNIPHVKIIATDISPQAIKVAKQNAIKHGVDNKIEFIQCNILPEKSSIQNQKLMINLICANLPYIPTSTLHGLPIHGHEPTLALDGGNDGLDLYRKLFDIAPQWISPNAAVLIEIEASQGVSASKLADKSFTKATVILHQDLASKDRLLEVLL